MRSRPESMTQDSGAAHVAIRMIAKLLAAHRPRPRTARGPRAGRPATNYVTLTDGVQIAVNVKVPPQCTAATPVPGLLRDVRLRERVRRRQDPARRPRRRDRPAVPVPDRHARGPRVARRRPLRDRARQPARHRLLVRRVRRLQLALGARRQGGHRQLDRQAAVVQRRRRDLRPLLQRPHRDDGRVDATEPPPGGQRLRPVRRHVPRHRLPRRRHQLRLPAAVDRRRPARLRHRRRHRRRPVPALETPAPSARRTRPAARARSSRTR